MEEAGVGRRPIDVSTAEEGRARAGWRGRYLDGLPAQKPSSMKAFAVRSAACRCLSQSSVTSAPESSVD